MTTPAGWYPSPENPDMLQRWSGTEWESGLKESQPVELHGELEPQEWKSLKIRAVVFNGFGVAYLLGARPLADTLYMADNISMVQGETLGIIVSIIAILASIAAIMVDRKILRAVLAERPKGISSGESMTLATSFKRSHPAVLFFFAYWIPGITILTAAISIVLTIDLLWMIAS